MIHSRVINTQFKGKQINQGFTLIELIVVIVMVGVLAALSGPTMMGLINRAKVNDAHMDLVGVFKEIQRQAVKKSSVCKITIPASETIEPTFSSDCQIIGERTLKNAKIRHNGDNAFPTYTSNIAIFGFQGLTEEHLDEDLIIVISHKNSNSFQKCLVISDGLGLIRQGSYPPNDTATPDKAKCDPD